MNLFMCVPLRDQVGSVKYFLGAQLDITGLVKDCTALDSLQKVFDAQKPRKGQTLNGQSPIKPAEEKDQFKELCELFNEQELDELREMQERKRRRHYDPAAAEVHGRRQPLSKGVSANFTKDTLLRGQSVGRTVGFYENVSLYSCIHQDSAEPSSISLCGLHRPSVYSLCHLLYDYQGSYNRPSWIRLAVAIEFVTT